LDQPPDPSSSPPVAAVHRLRVLAFFAHAARLGEVKETIAKHEHPLIA